MKQKIISLVSAAGAGKFLRQLKPRNSVTVLCLHRVTPEEDFFWPPMSPATFERLLIHCRKHYEVVDFSMLSASPAGKKPRLILSFDDGYQDFMEYALPLLIKYNLPCNHNIVINCLERNEIIWTQRFNVLSNHLRNQKLEGQLLPELPQTAFSAETTDWFGVYFSAIRVLLQMPVQQRCQQLEKWEHTYAVPAGRVKMMNWEAVLEAQRHGVSFGSHTVSHDSLPTLPEEDLLEELRASKAIIEAKTGRSCEVLSLPNGQSSALVVAAAKSLGYRFMLLLNEHLYRPNEQNMQVVSRINMVEEPAAMMQLRMELFHRPKHILAGAQ